MTEISKHPTCNALRPTQSAAKQMREGSMTPKLSFARVCTRRPARSGGDTGIPQPMSARPHSSCFPQPAAVLPMPRAAGRTRRDGPGALAGLSAWLKSHARAGARRALILGLPLLLLAACHDEGKANAPKAASLPVQVTVARTMSWPKTATVPATVSAVDVAVLAARSGGWVTQVDVSAGQRVTEGQPLVAVGLPAARNRLAAAEARVSVAKAGLDEASANEQRYKVLIRTHATSPREYDSVHRAFIAAKAELSAAQSTLAAARSDMDYADIRAPFAGTVVEKHVLRGTFATPGAPLLTIAGAQAEIRAYVGPAIVRLLKPGDTAQVDIGGTSQPATITRVVGGADPETHTHLVELRLTRDTSAAYGAYAELHFTVGQDEQLAVPMAALVRRAGMLGVFVVDKNDHAHFRLVRIGARHDGNVAVVAGLTAGEKVVVPPPANLNNDSPVRPEAIASAKSAENTPRG